MRVIIVHTLQDAKDALKAASELNAEPVLQSAPDALFYAGALYILNMFGQALATHPGTKAVCILDCADAGAEAIAAMQAGHKHIRICDSASRARIEDIAKQHGVTVHSSPYEALDLAQVKDTTDICVKWFKGEAA